MNFKEKCKYIFYEIKRDIIKNVAIVFLLVALIIYIYGKIEGVELVKLSLDPNVGTWWNSFLDFSILLLLISLIKYLFYCKIFFQKREIVDGHIYKKHIFNYHGHARDTAYHKPKAKAISEDGNISSIWQYYPKRKFKIENQPVKIIVKNNVEKKFYY